jgi:hypothetical protein
MVIPSGCLPSSQLKQRGSRWHGTSAAVNAASINPLTAECLAIRPTDLLQLKPKESTDAPGTDTLMRRGN